MRETWVRSLGQEDPLEKEMATHSSILAWRIPWAEEPGGLQSMGSQRVGHDFTFAFTDWMRPTSTAEVSLLYSAFTDLNVNFIKKNPFTASFTLVLN